MFDGRSSKRRSRPASWVSEFAPGSRRVHGLSAYATDLNVRLVPALKVVHGVELAHEHIEKHGLHLVV